MAEIEYLSRPATLYRYRGLIGGPKKTGSPTKLDMELGALEKRFLWGGSHIHFNDPMEGKFRSARRLISRSKGYPAEVQRSISTLGIASFCEIETHVLMWAHYAEQYQGICIAYDFSQLRDHMSDEVVFTRVAYTDNSATVTRERTDVERVAMRVLSRKTRAWLYEREWRMFSSTQGEQEYKVQACVRRVTLGHKMPDNVRKEVEKRLKKAKINYRTLEVEDLIMSL